MVVELLIIFFDLAFTGLLTWVIKPGNYYHYWAPFLLLIAGYILGVVFMWIALSIYASFYKKDKEYKKPSKIARFWLSQSIAYINTHGFIKLKIIYDEPLPRERFLLVCNHMSKFDPMIIAAKFNKYQISFISKPTNFKIPIGGHLMKASCYLSIDRYDKLKSLETMNEATRLISENLCSIGVFPEGTRHNSVDEFGPFHEGVFGIATKAKCPIVVTSILGSENIHTNFPKRSTKVKFEVLKVIYPEQYQGQTVKQISDNCREIIEKSIK